MNTETAETTAAIETLSHVAKPNDRRCRWWQKTLTADQAVKLNPEAIADAGSIPGPYHRNGADMELPEWSVIFDGEALHHAKPRGWRWVVGFVVRDEAGALVLTWVTSAVAGQKAVVKASGAAHLLGGSGDVANIVRCARWVLEAETSQARMERIAALRG